MRGMGGTRRRPCRFCADKRVQMDYKDVKILRHFVSETGAIVPRRVSGTCAKHQRQLTREVKRARVMALLPFTNRGL